MIKNSQRYAQRIRDNSGWEIGLIMLGLPFLTVPAMVLHWGIRSADFGSVLLIDALIFALPTVLLGVLILLIWRRKRFGTATLLLTSPELHLGERVIGQVETSLPIQTFESIRLRVWCIKITRFGKSETEHNHWEHDWLIPKPLTRFSSQNTVIPVRFRLPYSGEPTGGHYGRRFRWKISVETWPASGEHFCAEFAINVRGRRPGKSKAHRTELNW